MIFTETPLKGAYIIDPERLMDERGFFARTWCRQEFAQHGIHAEFVQCNISYNHRKGTLRGMHYQAAPHAEEKLVRCTAGLIHDVIVDLRDRSDTYRQWYAVELSSDNRRMLYIPGGFAHGFQTLADNVEVFYQMSEYYFADYARGIRWNDPSFGFQWPEPITAMSERDQRYPDYPAA